MIIINSSLNKEDIIIPSADFHPFPNIIYIIHEKYPEISKEIIKSTIWHNSSKYNIRDNNSKKYRDEWKIIKNDFHFLANKMIVKHFLTEIRNPHFV